MVSVGREPTRKKGKLQPPLESTKLSLIPKHTISSVGSHQPNHQLSIQDKSPRKSFQCPSRCSPQTSGPRVRSSSQVISYCAYRVGYEMMATSAEAIERAFAAKRRRPGRPGFVMGHDLHRALHLLDEQRFEMTHLLVEELDMSLMVLRRARLEASLR